MEMIYEGEKRDEEKVKLKNERMEIHFSVIKGKERSSIVHIRKEIMKFLNVLQ